MTLTDHPNHPDNDPGRVKPGTWRGVELWRREAGEWLRDVDDRAQEWVAGVPGRVWRAMLAADVRLLWVLWNLDRSVPGRTAELLGWMDRAVGRRVVAITYSPGWDRPLAALARFDPPVIAILGAIAWVIGIPVYYGPSSTSLSFAAIGALYLAVVVASREYLKTPRGRARTRYGTDGWATYPELQRAMSRHAVRMAAVATRPSIEEEVRGAWTNRPAARLVARIPVNRCGVSLGKTAVGPCRGVPLYAAHRDVTCAVAPPQTVKTAWMAGAVIDHVDGAVVFTSTKPDGFQITAALRSRIAHSGRVELFDPEGLAGPDHPSTFRWSPLSGCDQPHVAAERASAFVGATTAAGGDDGQFWLDSAAKVLRCFLLAAALSGRTMVDVAGWISRTDRARAALDVLKDREHRDRIPAGWAAELDQVLSPDAPRTRQSILLTLSQAVGFMADPQIAELCVPGADEPAFDVAAFLRDKGTLYVLGSERPHATIAPLLAAITSHVFEEAKRIAARSNRKGRLDPPLLLALDEAALITPVALDRWTADAGGRGIQILFAVQSPSQLAQRWGERGADTIWNNSNVKLIGGGLTLPEDLLALERLCGTRDVPHGDGGTRPEPLLPVNLARELPQWHVLVIHRSTAPTVSVIEPAWERADVKAAGPPPIVPPMHRAPRADLELVTDEETAA